MQTTSIDVSSEFHEQLIAVAKENKMSVDAVLAQALDNFLWNSRMEQVKAAMANASAEDLATYEEESRFWEMLGSEALTDPD